MKGDRLLLAALLVTAIDVAAGNATAQSDQVPTRNLARNGGFAESEHGEPVEWWLDGKQQVAVDDSGALRVDILVAADNNHYGEIRQTIPVEPNTRYRVEGRIKGDGP